MAEYIDKTKFEELMRKKARSNFDLYYADKSKHYHDCAIGYNMAADEAYDFPAADVQPVDRWISVKDRLPESGKSVLIYYPYWDGDEIQVAKLEYDEMMFDVCGEFNIRVGAVTHWMPLPEPPKDGDTNG